jgi:transposase
MLQVVKVRLYPNKAQRQAIHKTFCSCRFVYNMLLDAKIKVKGGELLKENRESLKVYL